MSGIGTVEVRIRTVFDARPVHLTDWFIHDLDTLLSELKAWGVYNEEGSDELSGQFVVGDGGAYFELIVGE